MGLLDDVLYFQFDGPQKKQKTGFADQTWWKTNLIENTWECFSLFFLAKLAWLETRKIIPSWLAEKQTKLKILQNSFFFPLQNWLNRK